MVRMFSAMESSLDAFVTFVLSPVWRIFFLRVIKVLEYGAI